MGVVVIGGGGSGGGGNPKISADGLDVKADEYVVATFASIEDAESYAASMNHEARVIPFFHPE